MNKILLMSAQEKYDYTYYRRMIVGVQKTTEK